MKPFYFLFLTFLLGCGGGNLVLDNPRDQAVVFEFDNGTTHEVAANATEEISLDPGTHGIVVKAGGEIVADTSFNMKEAGIVHSGATNYVVWRQLYGLQNDRTTLLSEKWVEFDSIRAYGDFKIYRPEWIYIENTWDYGLSDDLPESQSLYINKDFMIESKVFRSQDFIQKYQDMASQTPQ